MQDFAHRCGDLVIWNGNDWSEKGWITIHATEAHTRAGIRRNNFSLGWNGERFATSADSARLNKMHPDAMHNLRTLLARELKAPAKVSA
jgi:hypothetical protein